MNIFKRKKKLKLDFKVNSKKSKVLSKLDYLDSWVFKADSIELVRLNGSIVYCVIDGGNYALNGMAESWMKIKSVGDAKQCVIGKSISPFIKLFLEL